MKRTLAQVLFLDTINNVIYNTSDTFTMAYDVLVCWDQNRNVYIDANYSESCIIARIMINLPVQQEQLMNKSPYEVHIKRICSVSRIGDRAQQRPYLSTTIVCSQNDTY